MTREPDELDEPDEVATAEPAEPDEQSARPARRLRRVLPTAAGAVLALALTGGALTLGPVLPVDESVRAPVPVVPVEAGATDLVCPGPPRLPTTATGEDIAYDAELGPGPRGVSTDVSAVVTGGADATIGPLAAEDPRPFAGGAARADDATGPTLVRVQPVEGRAPLASARTWARSDAGDLRGLASAACATPASSIWLVGGSTAVSTSAQLTITNSGDSPARVHVTGWSGAGPEAEPAPILLAAGESRVVLLEAAWLADRIAVHLQSEGGRITAALQDSRLDGITPAGLDFVTAAAEPATEVLLAPAPLPGYSDPDAPDDPDGAAVPTTALRILNPGAAPATVRVTALGPDGAEEVAGAQELVVPAGTVTQIPLAARHAGSHGLRLRSDVPVTAAVEIAQAGRAGATEEADPDVAPVDIAWLPAAAASTTALLPADTGTAAAAHVLNPGAEPATVQATPILSGGRHGDPLELTVAAESTAAVPAEALEGEVLAWQVDSDVPVLASLIATAEVADGGLVTALPATPGDPGGTEVAVDLTTE